MIETLIKEKLLVFNTEFVEELKEKIPEKFLDLDLKFPDEYHGWIRFNNKKLDSVYLLGLETEYFPTKFFNSNMNPVLLKFKYRDFHYVPPSFVCSHIYVRYDLINEYRYNTDMHLVSKYIYLEGDEKIRTEKGNLFCKKIEENNKPVNINYILANDTVPFKEGFESEKINEMVEGLDINDCTYVYKENTDAIYLKVY
jgi:hypothetical protein